MDEFPLAHGWYIFAAAHSGGGARLLLPIPAVGPAFCSPFWRFGIRSVGPGYRLHAPGFLQCPLGLLFPSSVARGACLRTWSGGAEEVNGAAERCIVEGWGACVPPLGPTLAATLVRPSASQCPWRLRLTSPPFCTTKLDLLFWLRQQRWLDFYQLVWRPVRQQTLCRGGQ